MYQVQRLSPMCMGVGEGLRPVFIRCMCLGPTRALLGGGSKIFTPVGGCMLHLQVTVNTEEVAP